MNCKNMIFENKFYSEIPPAYDEAIKIKSVNLPSTSSVPIRSISLSIDQSAISNSK